MKDGDRLETTPQPVQWDKVEKNDSSKLKDDLDNIGKKKFGKFQDYAIFRKNLDNINNKWWENGLKLLQIILDSNFFDNNFLLKDLEKFYSHLDEKKFLKDLFENLWESKSKLIEVVKALKENYELTKKGKETDKKWEELKKKEEEERKTNDNLSKAVTDKESLISKEKGKKRNEQAKSKELDKEIGKLWNNFNNLHDSIDKKANSLDDVAKHIVELKHEQKEYFGEKSWYEQKKQEHVQRLSSDPKFQQNIKKAGYKETDIPALAELCATREVIATTDIASKSPDLTKQIVGDYDKLNAVLGLNANCLGKMSQDKELKNTNKSVQKFLGTERIQEMPIDKGTDDKLRQILWKKEWGTTNNDGTTQPWQQDWQSWNTDQNDQEFEKKKAELLAKINISNNDQIFNEFTDRIGNMFDILSASVPWGKLNNQMSYDRNTFMIDKWIEFQWEIGGKKFDFVIDEKGDFNFTDYFSDKQWSIGIDTKKLNNMFKFVPLSNYEDIANAVQKKLPDIIKNSNSEEDILKNIRREVQIEAEKLKRDSVVPKAELGYEMNRFVNGVNYIPFYKPPTATEGYKYEWDVSNEIKIDSEKDAPLFQYMKLVKETMNTLPVKENSQIITSLQKIEDYTKEHPTLDGDPNEDMLKAFKDDAVDEENWFNKFIEKFKITRNWVEVLDSVKLWKFVEAMLKKERFVEQPARHQIDKKR